LPDEENLTFNSGYAQDARQMLTGKLKARIAEPASQLLQDSDEQASAGAAWRIDSPTLDNRRTSPDASRTAFRN
jgi:hypothetical protein